MDNIIRETTSNTLYDVTVKALLQKQCVYGEHACLRKTRSKCRLYNVLPTELTTQKQYNDIYLAFMQWTSPTPSHGFFPCKPICKKPGLI